MAVFAVEEGSKAGRKQKKAGHRAVSGKRVVPLRREKGDRRSESERTMDIIDASC